MIWILRIQIGMNVIRIRTINIIFRNTILFYHVYYFQNQEAHQKRIFILITHATNLF